MSSSSRTSAGDADKPEGIVVEAPGQAGPKGRMDQPGRFRNLVTEFENRAQYDTDWPVETALRHREDLLTALEQLTEQVDIRKNLPFPHRRMERLIGILRREIADLEGEARLSSRPAPESVVRDKPGILRPLSLNTYLQDTLDLVVEARSKAQVALDTNDTDGIRAAITALQDLQDDLSRTAGKSMSPSDEISIRSTRYLVGADMNKLKNALPDVDSGRFFSGLLDEFDKVMNDCSNIGPIRGITEVFDIAHAVTERRELRRKITLLIDNPNTSNSLSRSEWDRLNELPEILTKEIEELEDRIGPGK